MSKFADIYGHEQIKEHLQNAIRLNKVSHAYIFNGPMGSGKKMTAGILPKHCNVNGTDRNPAVRVIPVSRVNRAISRILSGCIMKTGQYRCR